MLEYWTIRTVYNVLIMTTEFEPKLRFFFRKPTISENFETVTTQMAMATSKYHKLPFIGHYNFLGLWKPPSQFDTWSETLGAL